MIRPYPVPVIDEDPDPIDPFDLWPDLPRQQDDDFDGIGIRRLFERTDRRSFRPPRGRRRRPAA